MNGGEPTGAQSVDRALRLLSLVGRSAERGMSLSEIVEAGGLNKATTRRLLLSLMRRRFIHQDALGRRYYLGEEAYVVGTFAAPRFGLLEASMESLIRLMRKTGDSCFLSIRRDTHAICLHREDGHFPIRTHVLQKGFEHPLGIGAGSLAMLATLGDDEIELAMDRNREEMTRDYAMVSATGIRSALTAARNRGYAVNPGMIYPSSWGIGVALSHPDGRLAGALSIAAIDSRMQDARQRELAAILAEEAAHIELKLARATDPGSAPGARSGARRPAASLRRIAL